MNLAMMRDIDAADPIGGLGPRVTPAPTPAPAPVKRGDGFVVGPDGKLSTDLPDPKQEPSPILCKCGLTPAACAMTSCSPPWPFPQRACLAPEPLRVGDRVRILPGANRSASIPKSEQGRVVYVEYFDPDDRMLFMAGGWCMGIDCEGIEWERA